MIARVKQVALSLAAGLVTMMVATSAFAQTMTDTQSFADRDKWIGIAAGFGIALAAFGGALGQGRAASAFLDGVSRNPGASDKVFVPMILSLVFIETLSIYSLLIAFMLMGKI